MEIKEIDRQGRIVIPKQWRKEVGSIIVLRLRNGMIEILPLGCRSIEEFFDSIRINLSASLCDWHSLRSEILNG